MYININWLTSKQEFKFPNQEGYTETQMNYAIGVAEEWIGRVITGGLIEKDLISNPPKLKIVDELLEAYNPDDQEQLLQARDIKQAIGRATIFVLETGFNFITGSFSVSLGERSINELINFESSKDAIEDYIKTLLAKWYDPRLITLSTAVAYDIPNQAGGYIQGEDKPLTFKDAQKLFIDMLNDKLTGKSPIVLEFTIPNDPNGGKTIICNNCDSGGSTTDCHAVGQCQIIENKLDTSKLQDEFLKIWNNTNSDITISKGSLTGTLKKEILEPYFRKENFPEAIQNSISEGDNISITKTTEGIKINGKSAETPTWDFINKLMVDFLNYRTNYNYHAIDSRYDPEMKLWVWTIGGYKPTTDATYSNPDIIIIGNKNVQSTTISGQQSLINSTSNESKVQHAIDIDLNNLNDERIISGKDWKTIQPTIIPTWNNIKNLPINTKNNKEIYDNVYGIKNYIDDNNKWNMETGGIKPNGDLNTFEKLDIVNFESLETIGLISTECEVTHKKEFSLSNNKRIINVNDWKNIKSDLDKEFEKSIQPLNDLTQIIKIKKNDEEQITGLDLTGGLDPQVGIFMFSQSSGQMTLRNGYGDKNIIWQTYPQNKGSSIFMNSQGNPLVHIDLTKDIVTYKQNEIATIKKQTILAEQTKGDSLRVALTAGNYIIEFNWRPSNVDCENLPPDSKKVEYYWCGYSQSNISSYYQVTDNKDYSRILIINQNGCFIINANSTSGEAAYGNILKIIRIDDD